MYFGMRSFENRYNLGYNLLPGLVKHNWRLTYVGVLRDLAQRALLPDTVCLFRMPLPFLVVPVLEP